MSQGRNQMKYHRCRRKQDVRTFQRNRLQANRQPRAYALQGPARIAATRWLQVTQWKVMQSAQLHYPMIDRRT